MVVDAVDDSRLIVVVAYWVNVEVVEIIGSFVVAVVGVIVIVVVVGFVVKTEESSAVVEVVNSFTTVLEQSA